MLLKALRELMKPVELRGQPNRVEGEGQGREWVEKGFQGEEGLGRWRKW
jgi:hypothetical protein